MAVALKEVVVTETGFSRMRRARVFATERSPSNEFVKYKT